MPRDEESVVTIRLGEEEPGGKILSKAKLDQLAAAREKALVARRRKQKTALEGKLNELRHVLGNDLRDETVETFANAMMAQERQLRTKQNTLTLQLTEALVSVKSELSSLRKTHSHTTRPDATTQRGHETPTGSSRTLKPSTITCAPSEISSVSASRKPSTTPRAPSEISSVSSWKPSMTPRPLAPSETTSTVSSLAFRLHDARS